MSYLLGIIAGLLIVGLFRWNPWTVTGVLRIDHSNPEKDLYRLVIDDLDKISKKKRMIVKIDNNAKLSRK